jgi:hypothetical protein
LVYPSVLLFPHSYIIQSPLHLLLNRVPVTNMEISFLPAVTVHCCCLLLQCYTVHCCCLLLQCYTVHCCWLLLQCYTVHCCWLLLQCYISLVAHADVRCFFTDVIFAIQNYLQSYRTDVIAKCVANFLLVGPYSLQQLESVTLILIFMCRILCNIDCGMFNRWAICLADFVGLQTTVA